MKVLTDKTYWILMPPFLIIGILLVVYLPEGYAPYAFAVVPLFWFVYAIVKWMAASKKGEMSDKESDVIDNSL